MSFRRIASPWRLIGAASLSLAAGALPARAELVVFADGRVVKAASHQARGDQLEIRLLGGGSYSVDRSRIDQIVEDEVAHSDLPPPRVVETAPIIRAAPKPQAPQAPVFVPDSAGRQQADNDRANRREKDKGNRGGGHGGGHGGGGSRRSKAGGG